MDIQSSQTTLQRAHKSTGIGILSVEGLVNLTEPGLDSLKQTPGALKSCLRTHGIWVQNNNNSKIPVEVTTDPPLRFFLQHHINLQKSPLSLESLIKQQ